MTKESETGDGTDYDIGRDEKEPDFLQAVPAPTLSSLILQNLPTIINTTVWTSVGVGAFFVTRKVIGYVSDHFHSGSYSTVVGVGDTYNLQEEMTKVQLDMPSAVSRRKLRKLLNLKSSRSVVFQVATRKLDKKSRPKTHLTANAGQFIPLKNGMPLEDGGGKDPIKVADAFDDKKTAEKFEKKFFKRIDYTSVLLIITSGQGGTGGGFLLSKSKLVEVLKTATGANLVILVVVDTEPGVDIQNKNVQLAFSKASNFRQVDLIVNIQQTRKMDQDRSQTNKSFAPLLAALASPNAAGDDLQDVVQVTKAANNKMLTILDLGKISINTEHAARHIGKSVLNHPDERSNHFHVQINKEVWKFDPAKSEAERRKAVLSIIRPKWATDIDHEVAEEVEAKLGVSVGGAVIRSYWDRRYAWAYLWLAPLNNFEASSIREFTLFPGVYATEPETQYESDIRRQAEEQSGPQPELATPRIQIVDAAQPNGTATPAGPTAAPNGGNQQ